MGRSQGPFRNIYFGDQLDACVFVCGCTVLGFLHTGTGLVMVATLDLYRWVGKVSLLLAQKYWKKH